MTSVIIPSLFALSVFAIALPLPRIVAGTVRGNGFPAANVAVLALGVAVLATLLRYG